LKKIQGIVVKTLPGVFVPKILLIGHELGGGWVATPFLPTGFFILLSGCVQPIIVTQDIGVNYEIRWNCPCCGADK
jgi:hypothetical protein